jgi:hypothetical protein
MSMNLPSPCELDGAVCLAGRWGVIRAEGADAASFLQGQLTQDVARLDASRARLAGYCSAKGRLLATFVAWRPDADQVLLAASADLLASTLKRLQMFVLRAKCRLSDASDDVQLWGLAGASADAWLGPAAPAAAWAVAKVDAHTVIRLPDSAGAARYLCAGAEPALPPLSAAAWEWLEVRAGIPRIVLATAEQFVPQMVNLEIVGGVDFQKGCYPGQEVVARSQYRGTTKRRMALFESTAALAPGVEVFHPADAEQPAGMVVLAASLPPDRHLALVSLKTAALDGSPLNAAAARLAAAPMPYPVPVLAEA